MRCTSLNWTYRLQDWNHSDPPKHPPTWTVCAHTLWDDFLWPGYVCDLQYCRYLERRRKRLARANSCSAKLQLNVPWIWTWNWLIKGGWDMLGAKSLFSVLNINHQLLFRTSGTWSWWFMLVELAEMTEISPCITVQCWGESRRSWEGWISNHAAEGSGRGIGKSLMNKIQAFSGSGPLGRSGGETTGFKFRNAGVSTPGASASLLFCDIKNRSFFLSSTLLGDLFVIFNYHIRPIISHNVLILVLNQLRCTWKCPYGNSASKPLFLGSMLVSLGSNHIYCTLYIPISI